LAYVEVSSDAAHFVRFDNASLTQSPVAEFGSVDPRAITGLAGKYRVGYGTPFDLSWLQDRPEVRSGSVDLSHIVAVRMIDVVGDGSMRDSFGHVIYDAYPTADSAGFDLEAVGLLHVSP
jgi:hypothetical protein